MFYSLPFLSAAVATLPDDKRLISGDSLRSNAGVPVELIVELLLWTLPLLSLFPGATFSQKRWTFWIKNGLWTRNVGPLIFSFPRGVFLQVVLQDVSLIENRLFMLFPWCEWTFFEEMRFQTWLLRWAFSQSFSKRDENLCFHSSKTNPFQSKTPLELSKQTVANLFSFSSFSNQFWWINL